MAWGVGVLECRVDRELERDGGVFFFQAEDGIRDLTVTGVQTCALPIFRTSLDESSVEVSEVSEKDFRSAAETESPQGVIAIGEIPLRSFDTLEIRSVCRVLDRKSVV